MFPRLGRLVTRFWPLTILTWIGVLVFLRLVAPHWDDITHDGDLAYLPARMPSVVGQKMLAEAFPDNRAKSQIVIVVARPDGKLDHDDIHVAYDLARRFQNLLGAACIFRAERFAGQAREAAAVDSASPDASGATGASASPGASGATGASGAARLLTRSREAAETAAAALDEAVRLDELLVQYWDEAGPTSADQPARLAAAYHNRALLAELQGNQQQATDDRQRALLLDPELAQHPDTAIPADASELPLLDVWTWRDRLFGEKLVSSDQDARLIVLQLSNEFMATDNIRVLRRVEQEVEAVRRYQDLRTRPGLQVGISGSAAVGGDMLRAAADSIKNTELFTVLLVVAILILIYRSPLLVAVPLVTIVISLLVSTSLVSLLTQVDQLPGFGWWELKVFTTTKIFVVVILFGAGTDYCLFLISRYREELQRGQSVEQSVVAALSGVGDALVASALTTILGLSTMYFADFGKFRYSGPVIGLCLTVTLLTCVTLTPALLRGLGRSVFWPSRLAVMSSAPVGRADSRRDRGLWPVLARIIVARPGLILMVSILLMLPLAWRGFRNFTPLTGELAESHVSYDFLNSLADDRPSKQGARLMKQHFPVGESGPVTVLLYKPGEQFEEQEAADALRQMADALYVPGVQAVRCMVDPLGDYEPGEKPGVFSERGRRLRLLRAHSRTKALFVSQVPSLAGSVTRLELVLKQDPFSLEAIGILRRVDDRLRELTTNPQSAWHQTRYAYAGTTAGIRDLRAVTQSDNLRIEILVVLAVLAVLLVILRRPLVSLYMIGSVLLSFYVTIGATELFFRWAYGDQFTGLDWKVPLFLFVILVAVGQDYNVYLATRVFEEQRQHGPFEGLRRAVVQTGGIITSCGVIMAGTFLSMTSGAWTRWLGDWLPAARDWLPPSAGGLRGIVEMGLALALGVLLDTFVVRTILLPAFLSLLCRWQAKFPKKSRASIVNKE